MVGSSKGGKERRGSGAKVRRAQRLQIGRGEQSGEVARSGRLGLAAESHGAEMAGRTFSARAGIGGEESGRSWGWGVVRCHREGRVRREARRLGAASENPSGLDGQAARSGCGSIAARKCEMLVRWKLPSPRRHQDWLERGPGGGGETGLELSVLLACESHMHLQQLRPPLCPRPDRCSPELRRRLHCAPVRTSSMS